MANPSLRAQFPALRSLFVVYFNEDWEVLYGTIEAAIAMATQEYDGRDQAASEIRGLLATARSDDELFKLLVALGLRYDPRYDRKGVAEWMEEVARAITRL